MLQADDLAKKKPALGKGNELDLKKAPTDVNIPSFSQRVNGGASRGVLEPIYSRCKNVSWKAESLDPQTPHTDLSNEDDLSRDEVLAALRANEDGDASLFVARNRDRFLYDRAGGRWYEWVGSHWAEDRLGAVIEAIESVIDVYKSAAEREMRLEWEARQKDDKEQAKRHQDTASELFTRIKSLRSRYRKENVLWRAGHGERSLAITGDQWDEDPWLLACRNGVINLRDGSFRPGRQSDLIKTAAPVEWRGIDCPCPRFASFVTEIFVTDTFQPDPDMVAFVQRLLGYGLIGQVIEHVFPILWGPRGRNGKDTLCSILHEVLGDYVGPIQIETLLQSSIIGQGGGARSDLVGLQSKRIVWASEPERWHRLSPAKIKYLTGGGDIQARAPYGKHEIQFSPRHLALFLTNPKPVVMAGPADPVWDRILLIPFHRSFVQQPKNPWEKKADIWLLDSLKRESSGILAWLVRGCLDWQQHGLRPPSRVSSATSDYKEEENVLGAFVAECTEESPGKSIKARQLYMAYTRWCERAHLRPMSETEFGREMPLIIPRIKTKDGNRYEGRKLSSLGSELVSPVE